MCPICRTTLDQSDSAIARTMKMFIAHADRRGRNEVADRGRARRAVRQAVLAAPPKHGFNLLAWLLPLIGLLVGGRRRLGGVALVAGARAGPPDEAPRLDPDIERRIDSELARYETSYGMAGKSRGVPRGASSPC